MENRKTYSVIVGLLSGLVRPFVRVQLIGAQHLPEESAAIIVLNHVSLLDPVLFGVALRRRRQVRALAKESLFRKPLIGRAMSAMGHIAVHRGSSRAKDSLVAAAQALARGELVGIYPEGTVPPTVGELGEFKSGAARLALESGAPVIPAVCWGAQRILPRNGGKLKGLLAALFSRPIHRIYIGDSLGSFSGDPEHRETVNKLTEQFRSTIQRMLPLVRKEP